MRDSGILAAIEESGNSGLSLSEVAVQVKLSEYGVRVLLESGLSLGLVLRNDDKYTLAKTGYFILHDELTRVNMDFVQDICYKGVFSLDKSIETGKPGGLKELGPWKTVYEGLSQLPAKAQKSWFNFDHFFSDDAFPDVVPMVYKDGIKNVLDIGGNTGKWAIISAKYSPDVRVTIMDLPGQLGMAKAKIEAEGLASQVSFLPVNILDEHQKIPKGYDAIWMSQFLDCFSEAEIISILKRCYDALDDNGQVIILEPFRSDVLSWLKQ
jgi:hypothetical protein